MMITSRQARLIFKEADNLLSTARITPAVMMNANTDWEVIVGAAVLHLARTFVLLRIYDKQVAVHLNPDDSHDYQEVVLEKLWETLNGMMEGEEENPCQK